MGQVFIYSIECEVDGVFRFIVHADTNEDFDWANVVAVLAHLLEAIDLAILSFNFPQKATIHNFRLITLGTVVGADGLTIFVEGNFGIIDPLP